MVELIYELKNQMLERMDKEMREAGGADRVNVREMGEMADFVKDMAAAEKDCMEAEYYKSVVEAMGEGSGYSEGGQGGGQGGQGGGRGGRSGYGYGYRRSGRGSANQYGRSRGYGMGATEALENMRMAMSTADPQERQMMEREMRGMMNA